MSVNELVVTEGGKTTITTEFLSFTDDDTEPASLTYLVLQPPQLGHLQLSNEPGMKYIHLYFLDTSGIYNTIWK